ncbi:hypothetical protein DBR42_16860, partial [Pelomonas sp. HMWF004]
MALGSAGTVHLDQAQLVAGRDVSLTAGQGSNVIDSLAQGGRNVDLQVSGTLALSSTGAATPTALRAAGELRIAADSLTTHSTGSGSSILLAAGLLADGRLTGNAGLRVSTTGVLQSDAQMLAAGTAALSGTELQLANAQLQGQTVQLQATTDIDTRNAQVLAQGQLSATAQTLNNAGGQLSGQQLNLQVGALDNRSGSLLHTGTATLNLNVTSLDNRGGVIAANATDVNLTAQSLNTDAGQLQHAGSGQFLLQADTLSAQGGQILSGGNLQVQASQTQLKSAQVVGQALDIRATELNAREAQLVARNGTLQLTSTGPLALELSRAQVQSGGSAQITSAADLNAQQAVLSAAQDLGITAAGLLSHRDGAQAIAGANLSVQAGQLDAGGSLATASGVQYSGFTALGGKLQADIRTSLQADNTLWTAGEGLSLKAQDVFLTGSRTQLAAGQSASAAANPVAASLLLSAQQLRVSDALLATPGALSLQADSVRLDRVQTSSQDLLVQSSGTHLLQLASSQLAASRDVSVQASGDINASASTLQSGRQLSLQGQGVQLDAT